MLNFNDWAMNEQQKAKAVAGKSALGAVKIDPHAYWTLIAIIACENYSDNKQGMADTAQSIYNRYNVKGQPYGKTIVDIILAKNQYQPVTIGKPKGALWDSIKSKNEAIAAYVKTKGVDTEKATTAITNAISAQKDKTLTANAKTHVGSRTEFLATRPSSKSAASPTERTPSEKNNSFFWSYAGKTNYYDENLLSATSKPNTV